MPRHPTQPSEAIAIPHDSWFKLYTGRLQDMDNPKELWEVAVEAIDNWTRRHHPDGFTQVTHVGYQWKHLFLPPATLLRTIFRGKNYHCLVEAEHLLYEGKPVSPNVFVNAVGGVRRNAWRSIWVLYPNTTEWKLADSLRTRTRTRPTRARKVLDQPVPPATSTPSNDASGGTWPERRLPATPQRLREADAAAVPAAGSALPAVPAQCPAGGTAESALARLLLAELRALIERLGAASPHTAHCSVADGRWPACSFNPASYTTPHMQIAPRGPAARAAPAWCWSLPSWAGVARA